MPRTAEATDNWNEIGDENQVKFDTDGDEFTGVLTAFEDKPAQSGGILHQAFFSGTGQFKGQDYFTNMGRDLQRKLAKVPVGKECRITRTGTMDTGQETPMTTFKVDWR